METTVAVIIPLKLARNSQFPHQIRELKKSILAVEKEPAVHVVPVTSFLFKYSEIDYVGRPPYTQIYDD